eukprot:gnl/Dysnectes_brevis/5216_a7400_564.p1 GENE.gnl/Dysnectes_brevis/5216_a7400_564~~gnl/Dysnectes_brevis/5216_a7400_564.p1  ORF type:complete len:777 (+),score=155.98 gnl/Dysnectes_brevis/5216_a7400_564:58-2388(+)
MSIVDDESTTEALGEMLSRVLAAVSGEAILICLGFIASKFNILENTKESTPSTPKSLIHNQLYAFVMTYSLPALAFLMFARHFDTIDIAFTLMLVLTFFIVYLLVFLTTLKKDPLTKALDPGSASILALVSSFSSTIFFGYPILQAILGNQPETQKFLIYVVLATIFPIVVLQPFTVACLEREETKRNPQGQQPSKSLISLALHHSLKSICTPLIAAVVAGALSNRIGWTMDPSQSNMFSFLFSKLEATAIPLSLFSAGISLHRQSQMDKENKDKKRSEPVSTATVVACVGVKMIVMPFLSIFLTGLISKLMDIDEGEETYYIQTMFAISAAPPAHMLIIQAQRHKTRQREIRSAISSGIVFSFPLSLLIAIVATIGPGDMFRPLTSDELEPYRGMLSTVLRLGINASDVIVIWFLLAPMVCPDYRHGIKVMVVQLAVFQGITSNTFDLQHILHLFKPSVFSDNNPGEGDIIYLPDECTLTSPEQCSGLCSLQGVLLTVFAVGCFLYISSIAIFMHRSVTKGLTPSPGNKSVRRVRWQLQIVVWVISLASVPAVLLISKGDPNAGFLPAGMWCWIQPLSSQFYIFYFPQIICAVITMVHIARTTSYIAENISSLASQVHTGGMPEGTIRSSIHTLTKSRTRLRLLLVLYYVIWSFGLLNRATQWYFTRKYGSVRTILFLQLFHTFASSGQSIITALTFGLHPKLFRSWMKIGLKLLPQVALKKRQKEEQMRSHMHSPAMVRSNQGTPSQYNGHGAHVLWSTRANKMASTVRTQVSI